MNVGALFFLFWRIYRLPRDLDRERRSFDRAGLSDPERERERLCERPRSLDDRLLPERLRLLKREFFHEEKRNNNINLSSRFDEWPLPVRLELRLRLRELDLKIINEKKKIFSSNFVPRITQWIFQLLLIDVLIILFLNSLLIIVDPLILFFSW